MILIYKIIKNSIIYIAQLREILNGIYGPFFKAGLLLTKNVLKRLAKSVLVPLGLIVAASLTDWGKKALLIQSVSETVTNEAKEQKFGFLPNYEVR